MKKRRTKRTERGECATLQQRVVELVNDLNVMKEVSEYAHTLEAQVRLFRELLERVRCAEAPEEYLDDLEIALADQEIHDAQ